jgi:hypothetical protein
MSKLIEDFDANLAGEEGKTEETKSRWFQRIKKGILTPSSEKKEPYPTCGSRILYVPNAIFTTALAATNITTCFSTTNNTPSYSKTSAAKISWALPI